MMKTAFLSYGVVFLFSVSSWAQDEALPKECLTLKEHKPAMGVIYQPGVDVRGNPVVPADMNAPVINVPDVMTIPLSVDLAKRLPSAAAKGMDMKGTTGFLMVYKDGRVTYDGQDVTSQVYLICGHKMPETAGMEDLSAGGQNPQDALVSATDTEKVKMPEGVPVAAPAKVEKTVPLGEFIHGGEYND